MARDNTILRNLIKDRDATIARLMRERRALLAAARYVVSRWECGDLAGAVRELARLTEAAKHAVHWAQCDDCNERVEELLAEGLTQSDAQGVVQAEHRLANEERAKCAR
jgi:hypothetical protein